MKFRMYLVAGLVAVAGIGCGGGGGPAATDQAGIVQVPDFKYNVQSAVMRTDVTTVEAGLAGPDTVGSFTVDKVSAFKPGQVFVFNQKGYKITGIRPNTGAESGVLFTSLARLDEIYSDLKFDFTMHPVPYDVNGKVAPTPQAGVQSQLRRILASDAGQTISKIPKCIKIDPKIEVEREIEAHSDKFGFTSEVDCSIGEILGGNRLDDWLHIKGIVGYVGKTTGYKDIKQDTEYIDRAHTVNLNLIGALQIGSIPKTELFAKLKNLCSQYHLEHPQLRCEVEGDNGELKVTVAVELMQYHNFIPLPVPIPVYGSAGILFEIGISLSGEVSIGGKISKTSRVGLINGQKVDVHSPLVGDWNNSAKINGELDFFAGVYAAAGVGGNRNLVFVEAREDIGGYMTGTGQYPPPCLKLEVGLRAVTTGTLFRVGSFDGIEVSGTANWPNKNWQPMIPDGCEAPPGKIGLKYFLKGKIYTWHDDLTATPQYDSVVVNHRLIEGDHSLTLDLTNTKQIAGKAIAFDVLVLESSRGAIVNQSKSNLTQPAKDGSYLANIDVGGSTFGDWMKVRIKAYVPGDRGATETSRDVLITVEPQLAATPFFYNEIDTFDIRGHRIKIDIPNNIVLSRIKSGYIQFADGGMWDLEKEGDGWKTSYFGYHSCSGCQRNLPVKLVLFTNENKIGSGQEFLFSEDIGSRIDTIGITPAIIKVGDVVSVKINGRLIPADAKLEMPNCANIYEIRSFNNKIADNWATNFREFKCDAVSAGGDLIAKVTGIGFGITVYSILADPNSIPVCVAPKVLQGNVCVTPVEVRPGVVNPANGNRYEIITCGTWTLCDIEAKRMGGNLVTIRSKAENDWILANFGSQARTVYGFWIGQNDLTGLWGWTNGAADKYTNWDVNEPNVPSTDHYAHMYTGTVGRIVPGTWNNTDAAGRGLGIVQGIVEYTTTIWVPVANFLPNSVSIAVKVTSACDGGLVLNSAAVDGPNSGEWTVPVATAGNYRIEVEYAAALSRPVEALVDGVLVNANALADTSGSWCATPSITRTIGTVALTAGSHRLRLQRSSVFPHLKEIRFVPSGTGS